jgi:GT2 family glycosyltransferase
LLPLVVRNLRYIHVGDGCSPVSARNLVAEFAQGQVLVFLAGFAVPASDWLMTVFSAFDTDPTLAVMGPKLLRDDGVLENAGVTLIDNQSKLIGVGADPAFDEFTHPRKIDAVTGEAFAVRRNAWQRCGVSESHVALETALIDFCVQVTADGSGILYEPKFDVVLQR